MKKKAALEAAKKRRHVTEFVESTANWKELVDRNPRVARYVEAYLMMALRSAYRPAAPGDGMGSISLSDEQLRDRQRLADEALKYALAFCKEEDGRQGFTIGCSNFSTNRAFVLIIEAARVLAGGMDGDQHAIRLLELALEEIKALQ